MRRKRRDMAKRESPAEQLIMKRRVMEVVEGPR